jgi:hypothetical protein
MPVVTASIYWLVLPNRKYVVLAAGMLLCNIQKMTLTKVPYS